MRKMEPQWRDGWDVTETQQHFQGLDVIFIAFIAPLIMNSQIKTFGKKEEQSAQTDCPHCFNSEPQSVYINVYMQVEY